MLIETIDRDLLRSLPPLYQKVIEEAAGRGEIVIVGSQPPTKVSASQLTRTTKNTHRERAYGH